MKFLRCLIFGAFLLAVSGGVAAQSTPQNCYDRYVLVSDQEKRQLNALERLESELQAQRCLLEALRAEKQELYACAVDTKGIEAKEKARSILEKALKEIDAIRDTGSPTVIINKSCPNPTLKGLK